MHAGSGDDGRATTAWRADTEVRPQQPTTHHTTGGDGWYS